MTNELQHQKFTTLELLKEIGINDPKELVVRFCPSPTGIPHLGLIRTCLFNYATAKHFGGKFVFRIEDTDQLRDSEDSFKMIVTALKWLGLDWDEGVYWDWKNECQIENGENGPYRQSKRLEIYSEIIRKLLEKGYAYKCYSTKEEIDQRNRLNGRPVQFGYDNFDRNGWTKEQVDQFESEGREFTVRIKMPQNRDDDEFKGDIIFRDLVRGEVKFTAGTIPDYVIARASKSEEELGDPLYTLTNPVDDALMGINCVLRGEDLLSSTPRQVVLWEYLKKIQIAKSDVIYGHLPYVMGEGNKKLSKRDPESNLFLHRENGMIPEGLNNYLALLGWSFSADNDIFTMDEMIGAFDPSNVLANPAHFDIKKCTAINAEHIRSLDVDDFRNRLVPYLHGSVSSDFIDSDLLRQIAESDPEAERLTIVDPIVSAREFENLTPREQEILTAAAPLIQTRIQLLKECRDMLSPLLSTAEKLEIEEDAKSALKSGKNLEGVEVLAQTVLEKAVICLQEIEEVDWKTENIQQALQKELLAPNEDEDKKPHSLNLKPRFAFSPLRVAISGKKISPPLFECMEILGKSLTISRLDSLANSL